MKLFNKIVFNTWVALQLLMDMANYIHLYHHKHKKSHDNGMWD